MKHWLGGAIAASACAVAAAGCGDRDVRLDPDRVRFGGRDYRVTAVRDGFELAAADDRVLLEPGPGDRRHLSPCPRPRLIAAKLDVGDAPDLAFYDCGSVGVYIDDGATPLGLVKPVEGERKAGRWIHGAGALYRLEAISRLLPKIDPDAD